MKKNDLIYELTYLLEYAMWHKREESFIWKLHFYLIDIVDWWDNENIRSITSTDFSSFLSYKFKSVDKNSNVLPFCIPRIATHKRYEEKVIQSYKRVKIAFKENQGTTRIYRKKNTLMFRILMLYFWRANRGKNIFTWE